MRNIILLITITLLLTTLTSCYHYRVSSSQFDPSTSYTRKRVDAFFWGLVQKRDNGIDVVTKDCDKLQINKIDEVRVTTNFGYSLLNVITLGIWAPLIIEYKCAKPCPREGEIP